MKLWRREKQRKNVKHVDVPTKADGAGRIFIKKGVHAPFLSYLRYESQ